MTGTTPVRIVLAIAALALVTGCTAAPAASTATSALTIPEDIAAVKAGLDAALAAYKAGDKTKADALVGDAYLEHFEFVEGPLGKVDMAFMENLEDLIRAELRDAIKAGKPVADVESMVNEAKSKLDEAAQKLQ